MITLHQVQILCLQSFEVIFFYWISIQDIILSKEAIAGIVLILVSEPHLDVLRGMGIL